MPNDYGHEYADKELKSLEKRITKEYKQAAKEVEKKMNDYLAKFADKDAQMKKRLGAGEITASEYAEWRMRQMFTGDRWKAMSETLSADLVNVDKIAAGMINDSLSSSYAENFNYGTYEVESGANMSTSFALYDKNTVANLMKDDPKIIPKANVDIPKDMVWNKRKIISAVTQGILQGEAIPKIAKRLQSVTDMDRRAAIRNARTYTTAAENKGRIDSYDRAKDMGINVKKEWLATLDERTRMEHRHLDGMAVDNDEPFEVDGYTIMYPGDPSAEPEMIYNCRCTLVARIVDYKYNDERNDSKLGDMTYDEWKGACGVQKENLYMRFGGGIPVGEQSVNWLALSNQFLDEYQYLLNTGDYEDVKKFYEMIPDYAFESGVSAWEVGSDGFPVIDNLQGLTTLANFAASDEPLNIVSGDVVGKGNDNEPTLKNVKVLEESDLSREDIKKHVNEQMHLYFDEAEGEFDPDKAFWLFHSVENGKDIWSYGGVDYSSPKEGFDTRTGIKDIWALEERKKTYREKMAEVRRQREEAEKAARPEFKWQYLQSKGFELTEFTTKTGKEAFRYTENGVLKTVVKTEKYWG